MPQITNVLRNATRGITGGGSQSKNVVSNIAGTKRKATSVDPNGIAAKGFKLTTGRTALGDLTNNKNCEQNVVSKASSRSVTGKNPPKSKGISVPVNQCSNTRSSSVAAATKARSKISAVVTKKTLKGQPAEGIPVLGFPSNTTKSNSTLPSSNYKDKDGFVGDISRRQLPPPGVVDFDLRTWNDPNLCSEYAMDIFNYYKSREKKFTCADYMKQQKNLSTNMRSVLVDWMVEVQESFELNHETLYLGVKIVDLYLSKKASISKTDLQLIGASAYVIASKIDERCPPSIDDFVYICDDAFSRNSIVKKEIDIIKTVDFDVGFPLSYRFLRRYARVCNLTMPDLTFGRYILELCLMEYDLCVETSESLLATAVIIIVFKIREITGWVDTLKFYSGYSPLDAKDLITRVHQMLLRPSSNLSLKTIKNKYSHKVFHNVALISCPEYMDVTESG